MFGKRTRQEASQEFRDAQMEDDRRPSQSSSEECAQVSANDWHNRRTAEFMGEK